MSRAAGILAVTNSGEALFLKRSTTSDHAGEWCFPGGHVEEGETAEQAARREFEEETGVKFAGTLEPWTQQVYGGVAIINGRSDEAPFREADHPRTTDGKFGSGGGTGGASGEKSGASEAKSAPASKEKKKPIAERIKAHSETLKKHGEETREFLKGKSAGEVMSAVVKSHGFQSGVSQALQFGLCHLLPLDQSTWKLNEDLIEGTVHHFADIASITKLQAKGLMIGAVKALLAKRKTVKAEPKTPVADADDSGIDAALEALLDLLDDGEKVEGEGRGDDNEAVDFTTFFGRIDRFEPTLDAEHVGFAWAPIDQPPEPLHPGCRIAIDRRSMDELGVARAIADGRLTSPQRYENVTLFAIRITGTDTAFRSKLNEFVFRKPENYLTEEFLARCNGLPVVFKHPAKAILNSDEFGNRVVGTIFLPYVAGDEVWGIAKIFDDDTIRLMAAGDLSTSPGVNFRDFSVNAKLTLEDGSKVLIEGKPSLFDHVAICELGVWDKGGQPSGIRSESRGDSAMTEEELKAKKDAAEAEEKSKKDADEKAKADATKKDAGGEAEGGSPIDKTLALIGDSIGRLTDTVGAMHKRMDAFEEAGKPKADAARKDETAEEKAAEDKKKADDAAAKKDADDKAEKEKAKADSDAIRKRIDEVSAMIPKDMTDSDWAAMTDAQARADDVFSKFGQQAPRPLQGETPRLYERRAVKMLKDHSPTWKTIDLSATAFADDAAFGVVRDQVYREAAVTALLPTPMPGGGLRMITKRSGGHEINEFVGEPRSWMDPMAGATRQYVTDIKTRLN